MHHTYRTQGTCSSQVDFELDSDSIVHDIAYTHGCNGNLKAIGILAEGLPAADVIEKLGGLRCGSRATSCGDQLARALERALEEQGR